VSLARRRSSAGNAFQGTRASFARRLQPKPLGDRGLVLLLQEGFSLTLPGQFGKHSSSGNIAVQQSALKSLRVTRPFFLRVRDTPFTRLYFNKQKIMAC